MKNSISVMAVLTALGVAACSDSGGTGAMQTTTDAGTATGGGGTTASCALTAVEAGYGRIASSGGSVALNATITDDANGCATISWTQLSGAAATLSSASVEDPTVTLPTVTSRETLVFEVSASDGAGTTLTDQVSVEAWIAADSSADRTVLGDYSDRGPWQCDADPVATPSVAVTDSGATTRYSGNGVPDHATGTFPNGGNPNTISTQSANYFVPNAPVQTSTATEMAEFGVTVDGVKLERDTAESFQNAGVWRYEAITPGLAEGDTASAEFSWLGTDCNNAHVQPTGSYHYHGMMESLINRLGEGNAMPNDLILGGYAADGFPFYLRYGYVDANDPASGLKVIEASWELRAGTRASGPGGAYDGTFREDWAFVDGSGDLDECGGRFGPTPEFPSGVYHYYVTDDYPYIPRCVFGTPDSSFRTR